MLGVLPAQSDGNASVVSCGEVTVGSAKWGNCEVSATPRSDWNADSCSAAETVCGLCVEPNELTQPSGVRTLPQKVSARSSCVSVSRYCLLSGAHCRLPADADGTLYHSSNHNAYASAEMCRPFSGDTS